MKKLMYLIVLLLSAAALAQTPNWTSVKETNINVGSAGSVDIFTNHYGNHIIVQGSNDLKYYKMNIYGVAGSPITIENSAVVSPSISGDNDNIYIVYGMGTQMKIKQSTDGGSNWIDFGTFTLTANASSMESVVSNGNLHITYLESGIVKYRYHIKNGSWHGWYTVSTGETGAFAKITARYEDTQHDYVYFLYKKINTDIGKWRKYNVGTGSWGTLYEGYSLTNVYSSLPTGFRVTGTHIFIYYDYYAYDPGSQQYQYFFSWVERNNSNNTWVAQHQPPDLGNNTYFTFSTTTSDNVSHTAFYYLMLAGKDQAPWAIWRSKGDDLNMTDVIYEYSTSPYPNPNFINISSAGEEVHAIWQDQYGNNNGNNLRYKYDDQNPVAPTNLTLSSYNDHPKLVWNRNSEPDIDFYRIYKKKNTPDFVPYATVSGAYPTEYVDNDETVCVDNPPFLLCEFVDVAKYKITAIDLTDKESDFSNEVDARVIGSPPAKRGSGNAPKVIYKYELSKNYPNPFNPSTNIQYQIKAKGYVTLKVYNMLGQEVSVLVDEIKEPGKYTVQFNASNLPSGIYIYSLKVNDFIQNRKMILLK